MPPLPSSSRGRIFTALVAVYLIWGSTYLGVRVALRDVPPLLLVGFRYTIAGALLYAWLRFRGAPRPARAHWRFGAIIGALLVGGSAATAYALREVPTGVTAIACGSVPLWSILFARLWGERSTGREWLGLLLGLSGVLLLNARASFRAHAVAALVLWVGSLGWAFGSTLGRHSPIAHGAMASALQMMLGGLVVVAFGLATGERVVAVPSARSFAAFAYLVTIGSIVGYSAYVYLLPRVRPSLATSYAYVNPIVAIALGLVFENETLLPATIVASAFILGGVALLGFGGAKPSEARRAEEARVVTLGTSDVT